MERLRRLGEFWSWLPAFRAAAESEHLPTAAASLHVVPSALSRSIRLLEAELGVELFERTGRRIVLTTRGREFLTAVRNAMRLVDDGVDAVTSRTLRGEVRIASTGTVLGVHVLPALGTLRDAHPELVPVVSVGVPGHPVEMLLRGAVDVVFQAEPLVHPQVESLRLGDLEVGVFCSREHPLAELEVVDADDLQRHPFVAPRPDERGLPVDGWPPERPRRIGLVVDQVRVGYDACLDGPYLAVLPVALVRASAARGLPELHRLPVDPLPGMEVHVACRRAQVGGGGAAHAVVEAVRTVS